MRDTSSVSSAGARAGNGLVVSAYRCVDVAGRNRKNRSASNIPIASGCHPAVPSLTPLRGFGSSIVGRAIEVCQLAARWAASSEKSLRRGLPLRSLAARRVWRLRCRSRRTVRIRAASTCRQAARPVPHSVFGHGAIRRRRRVAADPCLASRLSLARLRERQAACHAGDSHS